MKVLAFKINEDKTLELDLKVIGYGFERVEDDYQWKDNRHFLNVILEGFFEEHLILELPPVFLTNEPFYSIDKVPFRLIRPFHLKAGWKIRPEYKSNKDYYFLIYATPEKYPSEQYLNPTKLYVKRIEGDNTSKMLIDFPQDIRVISYGFEFSYFKDNEYWWGVTEKMRGKISVYSNTKEIDVWTDGKYARLADWFGSLTLNGGKRVIKNFVLRNTEHIAISLERNLGSYAPAGSTLLTFFTLIEYSNLGFLKK